MLWEYVKTGEGGRYGENVMQDFIPLVYRSYRGWWGNPLWWSEI